MGQPNASRNISFWAKEIFRGWHRLWHGIKSAVENQKHLKSLIPELLGKKISQIKKVKMTLGLEDMKTAFGPIAKHYLPEEYERFCEDD